jgi:large subunit ribosomal protein L9
MKVTLLKDVKSIGKIGEDVIVKDGYALNYLIPQKLAAPVNSKSAKNVIATKRHDLKNKELQLDKIKEHAQSLNGKEFNISVKVGSGNKMYGSITKSDLSGLIGVDKTKIILTKAIKELGNYSIQIELGSGVKAIIKLCVVAKP